MKVVPLPQKTCQHIFYALFCGWQHQLVTWREAELLHVPQEVDPGLLGGSRRGNKVSALVSQHLTIYASQGLYGANHLYIPKVVYIVVLKW